MSRRQRPWILGAWDRLELWTGLIAIAALLAFTFYQMGNPTKAAALSDKVVNAITWAIYATPDSVMFVIFVIVIFGGTGIVLLWVCIVVYDAVQAIR